PLLASRRRDAGERIAAAGRRSFRQQRLEVGKDVAAACDRRAVHASPRRFTRITQGTVDSASAHSAAAGSGPLPTDFPDPKKVRASAYLSLRSPRYNLKFLIALKLLGGPERTGTSDLRFRKPMMALGVAHLTRRTMLRACVT